MEDEAGALGVRLKEAARDWMAIDHSKDAEIFVAKSP
jgi:hypothetical protein